MEGIVITSLSLIGDKALQIDMNDRKLREKAIFYTMFSLVQSIERGHRVHKMIIKGSQLKNYLTFDSLSKPIIESMTKNGAKLGVDYKIEELK